MEKWRKENPEYMKKYNKEWFRKLKKENPEKYKQYLEYLEIHRWAYKNIPYVDSDQTICTLCNERYNKTLDCANLNHKYNKILSEWVRVCKDCHCLLDSIIRNQI